MKRLFKQLHTFTNGLQVPKGTYVCLPTFAIENDPTHTPNPELFDGLRSYRRRQQIWTDDGKLKGNDEEYQFSSLGPCILNFVLSRDFCVLWEGRLCNRVGLNKITVARKEF